MNTRFLHPSEILDYFEKGILKDDLDNCEAIGFGSISDLLNICEEFKKLKLKILKEVLQKRYEALKIEQNGQILGGKAHIIKLDQEKLFDSLFDKTDGKKIWEKIHRKQEPTESIRLLTLKFIDDISSWWGEEVYQEALFSISPK
jgi:hypothetical protein